MVRLPFTMAEYEDRLHKIQHQMAVRELDGLILTKPDNVYYVSGYGASTIATSIGPLHCLLVPRTGQPRILTRRVEEMAVASTQWTPNPVCHGDSESPFDLLGRMVSEFSIGKGALGIEKGFLSTFQFESIAHSLPHTIFKDASGLVETISGQLSSAEIQYVRKAAEIAAIGFKAAVDAIKNNVHIYEVVAEIHGAMYRAGQADLFAGSQVGRRTPWVGVWGGPAGGCMHETSTLRKLEKGDLVTIEIWSSHHHYSASAQGTLFIGDSPSREIVDTYSMLSAMYSETKNALKAGVKAEEPYYAANKIYSAAKGADYFRTIGFSMGSGDVRLFKGVKSTIPNGMAFRVQSGIFSPLLIVICGTVVAGETGGEEITRPLLSLKLKT